MDGSTSGRVLRTWTSGAEESTAAIFARTRRFRAAGGAGLLALAAVLAWTAPGCGGGERQAEKAAPGGRNSGAIAEKPGPGEEAAGQVTELNREDAARRDSIALGGAENRPPAARFEVFPLTGYAGLTTLRFNANLSKDDQTDNPNLLKRWDYDGDGTWDSGAVRASRNRYMYDRAGIFRPRLLVEDTGGLRDSFVGPEVEIKDPCPAPDFELTDLNPQSRSYGKKYSLEDLRGHRVVVWFGAPSS